MRYYEDEGYRDDDRKKKKVKHSSNRPGQGMRIINIEVEEDIDVYDDFDYNYDDTTYNNDTQR